MTETQNKIFNQNKSIDKNRLFALCRGERKIARVEMMMLLHQTLGISVVEANKKANQLRPERESFYSLID